MSEKNTPKTERSKPNYKARRIGALVAATAVLTIPVKYHQQLEAIPVRLGDVIENANSPHGRVIAKHSVTIENPNGIKGSRIVVEQGNSGSSEESGHKQPYTVKIENADSHYGGVKYEQWGGRNHGVGKPIRVDIDSSGKEHQTIPK